MAADRSEHRIRVGMLAYGLDRPSTGIARYVTDLTQALVRHHPEIDVILLQPFAGELAGFPDVARVALPGTRLLPAMMALGPAEIAYAARTHRLDIVHDPIGISPFFPRSRSSWAKVVTIHDMVHFVYPETHARLTNFLFHRYMPRTLHSVDRIATVSDASKRDITRFYSVDPGRVTRIHCGIHERFQPQSQNEVARVCQTYQIDRPYLLAVGAIQPRKNLDAVLDSFVALRSQGVTRQLVIVGPKVWKSEKIARRIEALGIDDQIKLTGFVDDADLPALYTGADCFLFPSLYEGFGFPPLEAMACGTPVVASNASSLPEVIGEAGLLVDPHDIDALSRAIVRVLTEPAVAGRLRQAGMAQARRFTWAAAAAAHAQLYHDVARRSSQAVT